MYNARFWVPSQNGKWDGILQGETSIAAEVVHNFPQMYNKDERRL